MEDKTVQVTTYVLDTLYAKLKALADADKRSISFVVALAISDLVAKAESVGFEGKKKGGVQVDLIDAIAAVVKAGPISTAEKQAAHRKNMVARAERMADRAAKHK
jgi:predicted transcriptional regulator